MEFFFPPFMSGKYAAFLNFTSQLNRKHFFSVAIVIAISKKAY